MGYAVVGEKGEGERVAKTLTHLTRINRGSGYFTSVFCESVIVGDQYRPWTAATPEESLMRLWPVTDDAPRAQWRARPPSRVGRRNETLRFYVTQPERPLFPEKAVSEICKIPDTVSGTSADQISVIAPARADVFHGQRLRRYPNFKQYADDMLRKNAKVDQWPRPKIMRIYDGRSTPQGPLQVIDKSSTLSEMRRKGITLTITAAPCLLLICLSPQEKY
ncbi:hypothetical protein EVAR_50518_1 [Eumeta japonica]|uniref:Uncharacterized protein n=1 Tax=Eumeta variegata TaxID=151549 RepID=A0A4C1X537_EUMVA|nr:hypothetical protein EVAR_50518_1 [Eumeta japonica]